ncbi:MAG TPA: 50S ribosome-binding GTPase [Pirellulaceae bacterium]|nr:50S ribosome-binding GTPase [Pirellulaceae bacterium]HMO90711.1 50S ribosome-binding GTPase [Pirellulaceae bacterium]HMP71083.1 50S ribosome-binding GTPase [Pirellulaceae bacterium]
MFDELNETIVAAATPAGSAPRSIIRISGLNACDELTRVFSLPANLLREQSHPKIHALSVFVPGFKRVIPFHLAFWPNEKSYTRQPMGELHCIGCPPMVQAILQMLREGGIRLARPGEFTLRAFLGGRLDLSQAAAVLGVVDARTSEEMNRSLKQMAGGVSGILQRIQDDLLNLLADVEAGLDFVEEDITFISDADLTARLGEALHALEQCLEYLEQRSSYHADYRVVLLGSPNVGKSSLFNRLLQADVANIDSAAGTTRDFNLMELQLSLEPSISIKVLLVDTAGLDQFTPGPDSSAATIDTIAQQRSRQQFAEAHLRLFCIDGSRGMNEWEQNILEQADAKRMNVLTKADLPQVISWNQDRDDFISVSCVNNFQIDELKKRIAHRVLADLDAWQGQFFVSSQCVSSLISARESLNRVVFSAEQHLGHEIVAADIREAVDAIGIVTGTVYTEDILGRIFSRFCIGK